MTPIDWKRGGIVGVSGGGHGHHSLMTPIDWKPRDLITQALAFCLVTTR